MGSLDSLLERPHLARQERLLVVAKASVSPADWTLLRECVVTARETGLCRAWLEETLLQAVLFFGFPRCVSAFEVLQQHWPADASRGGAVPRRQQRAAGGELFDAIYGRNSAAVREMLRGFHQEFHDFVVEAAYGRILSRPGLGKRLRELLSVGALAVLRQIPQLVGHARGALHFGATEAELREVLISVLGATEEVETHMRRVLGGRTVKD